jgi:hypothetical protein
MARLVSLEVTATMGSRNVGSELGKDSYKTKVFYSCTLLTMATYSDYFANDRVLAQQPSNPPPCNNMTVAGCINACAADGYSSAGLEYASECFCDNKAYPIGQSDNSDCDMPCTGDASE